MLFTVHTPTGPTIKVAANSLEEVQAYVESRVPMQRRWSSVWHHGDEHWTYVRFNMLGRRILKGYEIAISNTNKKEYTK